MEHNPIKQATTKVEAFSTFGQLTKEGFLDYEDGFRVGLTGRGIDRNQSAAWRSGWNEAQEYELHFSWIT